MLCQKCGLRPATIHMTKIVGGKKTELHLCEECARESGEMIFIPPLAFGNFLAGLINGGSLGGRAEVDAANQCPVCGKTYADFVQSGKLGCRNCYLQFEEQLAPLIRRIHGSDRHTGKVPARTGGVVRLRREIEDLKMELARAVAREEYEKAAGLRDRIKALESKLGNS